VNRSKFDPREFLMEDIESLGYTKWECKYHVVFIPKCRRKVLYKELRRHLGEVFRSLAQLRRFA
jgi:putative transposase